MHGERVRGVTSRVTFPTLYSPRFGNFLADGAVNAACPPQTSPPSLSLLPLPVCTRGSAAPSSNNFHAPKTAFPFLLQQLPNVTGRLFVGCPPKPAPRRARLLPRSPPAQARGLHPAAMYRLSKIYRQIFNNSFQGDP